MQRITEMWALDLQKDREDQIWSYQGWRSEKALFASSPLDPGVAEGLAFA
jgi:hypothetical protein